MIYEIAEGGNTNELKKKVDELIDKGWKPIGGIAIASWIVGGKTFWLLAQAMIYEEE